MLAEYQTFGLLIVCLVRNPYKLFGGTFESRKGTDIPIMIKAMMIKDASMLHVMTARCTSTPGFG